MRPDQHRVASQRRRGAPLAAALLLGFALVLGSSVAFADDRETEANKLFVEAREKLAKNEQEEALELLNQAEELFAHPAISLMKAKTQRELGMLDAASETLGRVNAAKLPKPLRKVHDDETAEIVRMRASMGRLVVAVKPKDAMVIIDGKQLRGAYDRWRKPGDVRVEVLAPGHQPAVRTANITGGGSTNLEIVLAPLRGSIRVVVPGGLRGVDVLLDGKAQELDAGRRAGDATTLEVDLGKHEVMCQRGEVRSAHTVDIAFGQVREVRCEGFGGGANVVRLSLGWGGLATGLALAGYGAWGIQSYFADQTYAQENKLIVADTNKHYGGALYLASGLAIGVTSWLLFLRSPDDEAASSASWLIPSGSAPGPSHAAQ